MPAEPGFTERDLLDVAYLVDGQLTVTADDTLMAAGETSALTPDHRHPPGTILGFDSGTSLWYLATDSLVDVGTPPAITSSGHGDNTGIVALVGNHGTISVTITTGSGTEVEAATDLNADEEFNSHYIASSGAGELTITALNSGPDEWFYMDATTDALAAFSEGQANEVQGTDGDFRVTTGFAELKDTDAVAQNYLVGALYRGRFRRTALSSLTARAERVLLKRGSEIQ